MATDIVGSLFGVNPAAYQQAQQNRAYNQDYQAVQLDPLQQANLALRQGGRGLGQVAGGLMGMEDPELAKVSRIKQLSSQFNLADPQGLRDFGNAIKEFAPQEAMQAIAAADEREKSALGIRETKAKIEKAELSTAQEEKLRAELADAVSKGAGDKEIISIVSKYGSADAILKILAQKQDRADARASKGGDGTGGLGKLNTAEKAVDTKFGKEYADFFAGGGINNLEKNLSELDRAIKIIDQSPEGDTSGKLIGLADKTGQLTFVSPTAADVKDIIGGVAQSNLRQVLGGQFAAKEGEALLQRQYDTGQTKENNLKRLRALYKQANDTINQKKSAAQYYEQFGTLKGFKGTDGAASPDEKPPTDKNKDALDWITANPNDPRVPAIKKKLGIK